MKTGSNDQQIIGSHFRARFPQGEFILNRYPDTGNPSLRAWDAADELLLDFLFSIQPSKDSSVLLINDGFGALSCALHKFEPDFYQDSLLSCTAMEQNCINNSLRVPRLISLDELVSGETKYDFILGKIPMQVFYLDYLLRVLGTHIHGTSHFILAGMTRHMPRSVYDTGKNYFPDFRTSLAVKKARLLFFQSGEVGSQARNWPGSSKVLDTLQPEGLPENRTPRVATRATTRLEGSAIIDILPPVHNSELKPESNALFRDWMGCTVVTLPNTFSMNSLDPGSLLLASVLPGELKLWAGSGMNTGSGGSSTGETKFWAGTGVPPNPRILDVGCGNGLLSLAAALAYPDARITGVDESDLAVRAARQSFARSVKNFLEQGKSLFSLERGRFYQMDGNSMTFDEPYDVIMCNPPFHQQGVVNRKLALSLLLQARKVLAPRGVILVVANTSLGYQGVLRDYFTRVRILKQENGFSVIGLRMN